MSELDAHDVVATRDCKADGCPWDAVDARGEFAGLCAQHRREAIEASARARVEANERRRAGAPAGEIAAAARAVLAESKRLEAALAGVYAAERRREEATRTWRESVGELLATTKRFLDP